MVAGVADHRVSGLEDRPDRAEVRLVAGREHDRVVGPHPLGDLALELGVQGNRAVQQPRPGEGGAVALQRLRRGGLDARIAGQPQVVVGAEHDRLPALHLDHRPGLRLEHAEVGDEVRLLRGLELLGPVVRARLLEHVDRRLGAFGDGGKSRMRSGSVPPCPNQRPICNRHEQIARSASSMNRSPDLQQAMNNRPICKQH